MFVWYCAEYYFDSVHYGSLYRQRLKGGECIEKYAISQTALSLFRNCPYAYKLKYIDRCKQMFYDPSILDVGSYVHNAIDRYYKLRFLPNGTSSDILTETYSILTRQWDTSLLPKQLKQAYTCLENHAEWEYGNVSNGIRAKPFTEQKLKAKGYYGIIDYVDLQYMKVIDWKTGSKAYLSFDYRMQAHVYKVLFEETFHKPLPYFLFFFLYPNDWRKVDYTEDKQIEVGRITDDLQRQLMDALDSGVFERNPRTHSMCKSCDLAFYCGMEQKESEEDEEMFV